MSTSPVYQGDDEYGALESYRRDYVDARHDLEEYVARICPGPHRLVQHRDGKPPWCPACRKTWDGVAP